MVIQLYFDVGYKPWYGAWILDIYTPLTIKRDVCLTRHVIYKQLDIASLYLLVKSQIKKHQLQYKRENRKFYGYY
ncbi:hypothetical protein HOR54_gp20 [Vibrio phage Vp670]|uniref:Uncharacterized protein n=1 Tax=Vibrio phage Vp670 TaxID=1932890 RepID=A0A1L7DPV6_9CAUD|nr:hypothetical protein HOR54_gp20 [Vibrio phage Vp670]APU00157.1 hypothetical protein QD07_20 [Vibrio phage Vp670]